MKPTCFLEMPSLPSDGPWRVRDSLKDLLPTDRLFAEYTANLRIILCANSTSRIIGPIRSRCLLMRVGAPTEEEVRILFSERTSLTPH
jgi:DNA polymerase III delta prime subunit